jgi:hypothetical protein
MPTLPWFACLVLSATIVPALAAKTNCPGNVASVPFQLVNRHWIVLAVSVNHTGPYEFLLDSGAQITMIDPSLAATLHLDTQGLAEVVGPGSGRRAASYAQLDLVEAGSHSVAKQKVLVSDLRSLRTPDLHLQGILGEDFLEQFDLLIDNAHRLLCLDESSVMRAEVKGQHIPLEVTAEANETGAAAAPLILTVRLTRAMRPLRLLIDSGANEPILFNTYQYMFSPGSKEAHANSIGVDGAQMNLSVMPPQDVTIGSLKLPDVTFLSAPAGKDSYAKRFDGVLTMGLFRRVFVDHTDRFVILEPR